MELRLYSTGKQKSKGDRTYRLQNEADDQYAVAHHLMTPRFDVKGLVAGHFWKNPQQYGELGTAQASYDEIIKVMDLMGLKDPVSGKAWCTACP